MRRARPPAGHNGGPHGDGGRGSICRVNLHHVPLVVSLVLAAPALAQAERTIVTTTPQGVFYQRTLGNGPSGSQVATDAVRGLRWTYPSSLWITESVSVGNHGTFAWLGQNTNSQRYSLLGTTDNNPPTPIFELPQPGSTWDLVKAADKAPFAVTASITISSTSSTSVVEFWSGYSPTPIWTTTILSGVAIDISETGQFVAVGTSPTQTTAQVDIYDMFGVGFATAIATLPASSHGLRNMDLSDDGSTLLLATNTQNHVFDVATQQQLMQASTVSHDAHAISRDGHAWGRGGFNPTTAWVLNGGSYTQVLNYNEAALGFAVYAAAGISNDGTTFAAAAYDAQSNGTIKVCCWDLTPTGSTLLWSYTSVVAGTLQNTPQAVSISDDGSIIAVGSWGDSQNASPEVLLFARNGTGTPIANLDPPGSCFDLDLSGDGQFLVVGTKSVHANTFGRGGEGYSYDLGNQDLWLDGTPSVGRTVTLTTEAAPGEIALLGFSGRIGTPLVFAGIGGELQLDLASYRSTLFLGVVPASGNLVLTLPLPNLPGLVGVQFAVQALHGGPFAFTNALRLPITL